jgi:hypothetical protein
MFFYEEGSLLAVCPGAGSQHAGSLQPPTEQLTALQLVPWRWPVSTRRPIQRGLAQERIRQASANINNETIDENAFGMAAYIYTASNEASYTVEVNYSNMLGSLVTLTINRPT